MTREEAANWLEHYLYGKPNILRDCDDDIAEKIQTALDEAIFALRGPVPDPQTGLVPCGCGGKAYMADWSLFRGHLYSMHCLDCNTQTDHCESQKEAKARWNTAHGYKGDA